MTREPLSCNDVRELIESGRYPDETLAHLPGCDECLQLALNRILLSRRGIPVPPSFAGQVLAQAESSRAFSGRQVHLARGMLWPGIAALCAFFGIVYLPDLIALTSSLWGTALLAVASIETCLIILWLVTRDRADWIVRREHSGLSG
jgi:hypothetical protein